MGLAEPQYPPTPPVFPQHGIRLTQRSKICAPATAAVLKPLHASPECSAFIFPSYIIQVQIINSGYQIKM